MRVVQSTPCVSTYINNSVIMLRDGLGRYICCNCSDSYTTFCESQSRLVLFRPEQFPAWQHVDAYCTIPEKLNCQAPPPPVACLFLPFHATAASARGSTGPSTSCVATRPTARCAPGRRQPRTPSLLMPPRLPRLPRLLLLRPRLLLMLKLRHQEK